MSSPHDLTYCMKVLAQKQILIVMRARIDTEKLNGNVIVIKYQCETNHTTAIRDMLGDSLKYSQISRLWNRVVWVWFFFFSNMSDIRLLSNLPQHYMLSCSI